MKFERHISLNRVPLGRKVRVETLLSTGSVRRRMLDIGLIPGTLVEPVKKSPYGDPTAYRIRGALIAIRSEDADKIIVKKGEDFIEDAI